MSMKDKGRESELLFICVNRLIWLKFYTEAIFVSYVNSNDNFWIMKPLTFGNLLNRFSRCDLNFFNHPTRGQDWTTSRGFSLDIDIIRDDV